MKIAVIGSGYVGVVTAAGFAEFGNHVIAVDKDAGRVQLLSKGKIPFYERDKSRAGVVRSRMTGSSEYCACKVWWPTLVEV